MTLTISVLTCAAPRCPAWRRSSSPHPTREKKYVHVVRVSQLVKPGRQRVAAHRGDAGGADERARPRRPLRRRDAEALVGQLDDDVVHRVRPRAHCVGAGRLRDGVRAPVAHLRCAPRVLREHDRHTTRHPRSCRRAGAGEHPLDNHRSAVPLPDGDARVLPVRVRGDHPDPDARVGTRPDQLQGLDPVRGPVVHADLHGQRVPDLGRRLVGAARRRRLLGRLRDPSRSRRVGLRRGGGDRTAAEARP